MIPDVYSAEAILEVGKDLPPLQMEASRVIFNGRDVAAKGKVLGISSLEDTVHMNLVRKDGSILAMMSFERTGGDFDRLFKLNIGDFVEVKGRLNGTYGRSVSLFNCSLEGKT